MFTLVFQSLYFYGGLVLLFFEHIESFIANVSIGALIAIPAISVALLLPIAFFLIENSGAYPFDRKLIINDVVHFKSLMLLIMSESVLLCMADNHTAFKLLSIITDGFLVIVIIFVLMQSYKWLCASDDKTLKMSYRQALRIQYLKDITNTDELYETWMQIFANPSASTQNEKHQATSLPKDQTGLVDALVYALRRLEKSSATDNDAMKHTALINATIKNFDNFSFDNIEQYRELIKYTTTFAADQLTYDSSSDVDEHVLFISSNKFNLLARALKNVIRRPVYLWRYTFFNELKESAERMRDDQERRIFYQVFLKKVFDLFDKNPQIASSLWNHMRFLRELTLIENHQVKQADPKIQGLLHAYEMYLSESVSSYIDRNRDKKGQALDLISSHIFEDVDLVFWFDIMTFFMIPAFGQNFEDAQEQRIKTWCQLKKDRQFGQLSRIYVPFVRYNPSLTDKERMSIFAEREKTLNAQGQQIAIEIFYEHYKGIMDSKYIKEVINVITSVIVKEKADDARYQQKNSKNNAAAWQQDKTFRNLDVLLKSLKKMLDYIDEKGKSK